MGHSLPVTRASAGTLWTGRAGFRQVGDNGESFRLTGREHESDRGETCSRRENSGKGALSPLSTGPTEHIILILESFILLD